VEVGEKADHPAWWKLRGPSSGDDCLEDADKIIRGFDVTSNKGAGIRVYEYASSDTIAKCRSQLEALFWLCADSEQVAVANGMTEEDAAGRKAEIIARCNGSGSMDTARLTKARISTYGRGCEPLLGTYTILDLVPKGRDEDYLGFTMEWVRHHDRYSTDEFADANNPPSPATASPSSTTCACGSAEAHS